MPGRGRGRVGVVRERPAEQQHSQRAGRNLLGRRQGAGEGKLRVCVATSRTGVRPCQRARISRPRPKFGGDQGSDQASGGIARIPRNDQRRRRMGPHSAAEGQRLDRGLRMDTRSDLGPRGWQAYLGSRSAIIRSTRNRSWVTFNYPPNCGS
jgi:hypothetical protein